MPPSDGAGEAQPHAAQQAPGRPREGFGQPCPGLGGSPDGGPQDGGASFVSLLPGAVHPPGPLPTGQPGEAQPGGEDVPMPPSDGAGEAQPHAAQRVPDRPREGIGQRWQERFGGAQDGGDSVMRQAGAEVAQPVVSLPGPSGACPPAPGVTSLLPRSPACSVALDSSSSAQQVPVASRLPRSSSCYQRPLRPKPKASGLRGQDAFLRPPVRPGGSSAPTPPAPDAAPLRFGALPQPSRTQPPGQAPGLASWGSLAGAWGGPPQAAAPASALASPDPPAAAVAQASIPDPPPPPTVSLSPEDRVAAELRAKELKALLTSAQLSDPGSVAAGTVDVWVAELEYLVDYFRLPRCMAWHPR